MSDNGWETLRRILDNRLTLFLVSVLVNAGNKIFPYDLTEVE